MKKPVKILLSLLLIFGTAACAARPMPEGTSPAPEFSAEAPVLPPATPGEPVPQTDGRACIEVLADGLNVRAGAGTQFPVLGTAQRGTLLLDSGRTGDWYRTLWRGKTAFVSANKTYTAPLSLDAGDAAADPVIAEGLALLGTPYVYGAVRVHDGRGTLLGGFSADRFDCSSLMQYIFYRGAGVLLDVTTRTQIKQGTHVCEGALKIGDLMFFTNAARKDLSGIERVGHVALWLGGGYILHTASDFAKVEPLSPLRRSYFLEARRIL